jgi:hypothetical protein
MALKKDELEANPLAIFPHNSGALALLRELQLYS